ncbi:MAG: DUF1559 domain-containing protein [Planctomycetaceae bacterium]|nr:DUF1559 domain-containing protein [Planctomycetaceae bacterium]
MAAESRPPEPAKSATSRKPRRKQSAAPPAAGKLNPLLIGGGALGVLLVVGGLAWALFGGGEEVAPVVADNGAPTPGELENPNSATPTEPANAPTRNMTPAAPSNTTAPPTTASTATVTTTSAAPPAAAVTTKATPAAGDVNLIQIDESTIAALVVRPIDILTNDVVQRTIAEYEAADDEFQLAPIFEEIGQEYGMSPADIEYIVVSLSAPDVLKGAMLMQGPPSRENPFMPTVLVHARVPFDEMILADLIENKIFRERSRRRFDPEEEGMPIGDDGLPIGPDGPFEGEGVPIGPDGPFEGEGVPIGPDGPFEGEGVPIGPDGPPEDEGIPIGPDGPPEDEGIPIGPDGLPIEFGPPPGMDGPDDESPARTTITREQLGERTLYVDRSGITITLLDEQTLLFGLEAPVKSTLERSAVQTELPLVKQLQPLTKSELTIISSNDAIAKFLPSEDRNSFQLSLDMRGKDLLSLVVATASADAATQTAAEFEGLSQQAAGQLNGMTEEVLQEGLSESQYDPLLKLITSLGPSMKTETNGTVVKLTLPRPAELDSLPQLVRPIMDREVAAVKEAKQNNALLVICSALTVYMDANGTLPAYNENGLSWRVHILPFLYEDELYEEFHLDEPWDSEHNKTLIERMPPIFGNDPAGVSSIHTFVGPGTLFTGPEGQSMYEISDPPSETILFVRAGESTAEPWTKPGGLTLDPSDPLAALGNINEMFTAIMADSSRRKVSKDIDPDEFRSLVNPNDENR